MERLFFPSQILPIAGISKPSWIYIMEPVSRIGDTRRFRRAPIVAAVAVPDVSVPISNADFLEIPSQLGFSISRKAGLSISEFQTASKCLLNHPHELQDTFGNIADITQPLSWLALVDDSAAYGP